MQHIWQTLPKPFFVLAPMEEVTDTVVRQMIARLGRPDLFFTEFTSVEGMLSPGSAFVGKRLQFTELERPLIAQIWGEHPENYFHAAKMLVELGFDGIDINMGCPDKAVLKKGVCSALIRNKPLASEIIAATKEGAGKLPVSVKTRIGYESVVIEDWIGFLLEQNIAALTIHARTVKEGSKVPAHWEEVKRVVSLRDQMKKETYIVGNGDITSFELAQQRIDETGVDGVMIGRGIFHDPWIFNKTHHGQDITLSEKLQTLQEHVTLFDETWQAKKQFAVMKKFIKCYINGFKNAAEIRTELMELKTPSEVLSSVSSLLQTASV